ncbi:uncharacterized protein PAC_17242 [Phialocephala subalpina]|uniref:F-box domain-containing protein n=1 Tax=Phialocephala subalpina TaxID=576137 RepID=A0A1L7XQM8_9HELO|nr:uncharacterized protein PAC_17242 [Phialocephala subalpina]
MAPRLGSLSDELLLMILEEVNLNCYHRAWSLKKKVNQTSPHSLLNVCLVSQQLCRLASSLIYQQVSIPANKIQDDDQNPAEEIRYTFEANVVAHTRHLTVDNSMNWSAFRNLLPRMQRLETITWHFWETPFPAIIKRVLSKQLPDVKLYIEEFSIGYRTDDEDVQKADLNLLKSLVGIPNIHAAKVEINYEHPVSMRWLKDVLLSSKKLEILHLTLPRNRDGRIEWGHDDLGVYDLCIEDGEQLENLKELVYECRCYDFKKIVPISFFNWSKIRHLELRGHVLRYYVDYLRTQDVYFQTLVLEFIATCGYRVDGDKIVDDFITQLHGLERLELANPYDQLPVSTIALHGNTLKSLSIRFIRRSVDPYSFLGLTLPYEVPQLESLNVSCPHITSLALDVGLTDFLPYDILAALSRFPNLTSLRVYCTFADLGTYYASHYDRRLHPDKNLPHVHTDRLTVRHMFSYISAHKIGEPFERLEVMFGNFPRSMARITMRPADQERPNVLFICHKDEDGNAAVEDDVTDNEDPGWDGYFNAERLKNSPGQTWPENLEDIMAAEEEADRVLKSIDVPIEEVEEDGTDSLFGES